MSPDSSPVRTDPRANEGWWYEGGGIYRHTRLVVLDSTAHLAHWGVYVPSHVLGPVKVSTTSPPMYSADSVVKIYTEVVASVPFYIHSAIVSSAGASAGKVLWEETSATQSAGNGSSSVSVIVFQQTDLLLDLPLWDVESPQLHTLVSSVIRSDDGEITDTLNTTFGVRKVELSVDYGLFLNDRK